MRVAVKFAVLFVSFAVWSNVSRADDTDSACATMGSLATSAMRGRQAGADMAQMMDATMKLATTPALQPVAKIMRNLIVLAYQSPRYSTEEMQTKAIQDFTNQAELGCYQGQK